MMEIDFKEINGFSLAELISDKFVINETQDALDLMGNIVYNGSNKIIIKEQNLNPAFFDLKTGLAGDILQKFSNYDAYLAIVGDFSKYDSKSLKDFIYESNKYGRVNFVNTMEEAINCLTKA
jgi:hypothetical protein